MKVVRDRADARWLPSRFDFALFRLLAYFRLKTLKPEPRAGIVMSVERHQSAAETYTVSMLVFAVLTSFVASMIATALPLGSACVLAVPATAVLISVQIVLTGVAVTPVVRRIMRLDGKFRQAVNGVVLSAIAITAAVLLTLGTSPLRHVGTVYLAVIGTNAVASVVVFLMQGSIAAAERPYGVEP